MARLSIVMIGSLLLSLAACNKPKPADASPSKSVKSDRAKILIPQSFGQQIAKLRTQTPIVILKNAASTMQVAVAPELGGRVVGSTLNGEKDKSTVWLNPDVFTDMKQTQDLGGNDIFELGPEFGPHSVYVKDDSGISHLNELNRQSWNTESNTRFSLRFSKNTTVKNQDGHAFDIQMLRTLRILSGSEIRQTLKQSNILTNVKLVGHESIYRLKNTHEENSWSPEKGLLSVRTLSALPIDSQTTFILPVRNLTDKLTTQLSNANINFKRHPSKPILLLKPQKNSSSQLGISFDNATPIIALYHSGSKTFTWLSYNLPTVQPPHGYAFSTPDQQYANASYVIAFDNQTDHASPHVKIQTSSPLEALAPGRAIRHKLRTIHFTGSTGDLNTIIKPILGISVADIETAFPL